MVFSQNKCYKLNIVGNWLQNGDTTLDKCLGFIFHTCTLNHVGYDSKGFVHVERGSMCSYEISAIFRRSQEYTHYDCIKWDQYGARSA